MSKEPLVIPNYGDEMSNKILDYVKSKVDIDYETEDNSFDKRLLIDIESALSELQQLTKCNDFSDINEDTTFDNIIEGSPELIALCKTYIGLCVRISFDPPSGSILTTLEKSKDTIASRITIQPREVLNE